MTAYTGPSIVDYLGSLGQASDFTSRATLATQHGITNYQGTADQNTQLLNALRSAATSTTPTTTTPTTTVPSTSTPQAPQTSTPVAPPTIDTNAIMNTVRNGGVAPDQMDAYISNLVTQAYTSKSPQGTSIDTGAAQTAADQIKNQLRGTTFWFNGQQYQYAPGGSTKVTTTVYQSTTGAAGTTAAPVAAAGAIPTPTQPVVTPPVVPPAPGTPAVPGAPVPGAPIPGAPVPGAPIPGAPIAPTPTVPTNSYTGASIVDYLNSIGKPSDYASRTALARELGISGYTGTAAQNSQMLSTLREMNGGHNAATAVAAAAHAAGTAGAPATPGGTPGGDAPLTADDVMRNASAIFKQLGGTAPDPNQSPLNIATNLFTQGLSFYGLNDLKTQINASIEEQAKVESAKADEVADINANPWLTEGERLQRIKNVDTKYETKLDIAINKRQLYEADYKTGLDQVQWLVGQAMDAYKVAQSSNEKLFSDAISIAEKVVDSNAALAKEKAAASKPVTVGSGSSLVDPTTGNVIYKAPSTTTSGTLTRTQVNDGAVKAGLDVGEFTKLPSDVQNYFSNTSDTAIEPLRDALVKVSKGEMSAKDFATKIDNRDFGTISTTVKSYLKSQANEAEKVAPPKSDNPAEWWNPLTWF